MTTCLAPQSAPRAARRKHAENARFAVTLGAAFALLCSVVFESPDSFAANGLIELLFGGGGGGYYVQPAPAYPYADVGYGRSYGRHRHARRNRTQYARAHHRSWSERRAVAFAERRDRRAAEMKRVVDVRAVDRRHISTNMRRLRERKDFVVNAPAASRDFVAIATPIERNLTQPRSTPVDRKPVTSPIEKVSFAESVNTGNVDTSASHRAVCVRVCDGYFFPIAAKSTELAAQQSCERLCPGAETKAFLLPSGSTRVDDAVAAGGGETYAQFVARLNPETARAKSCGCPQSAGNLRDTSAFLSDLTLRPGDTVVTEQGVRVVRRGSRYPFKRSDFVSLAESRALPRATRGALFAIDRALRTPYGRLAVASNSERRRHRLDANL